MPARVAWVKSTVLLCRVGSATPKKKKHIDSTHVPSDTRDEGVDACHRSNMFVNEIPSSPDTVLIN